MKKLSARPQKEQTVKELKEKLTRAKAVFLSDYRGLTHQQLESLRVNLKKVQGEFVVAKNTLFSLAFAEIFKDKFESIKEHLKNPTATLLAYGDEINVIKVFANFIKTHQLPKIKIGLFSGEITNEAQFNKLATLPTREVLLGTLVARLKSPLYGLHYALSWNLNRFVTVISNIKSKKG